MLGPSLAVIQCGTHGSHYIVPAQVSCYNFTIRIQQEYRRYGFDSILSRQGGLGPIAEITLSPWHAVGLAITCRRVWCFVQAQSNHGEVRIGAVSIIDRFQVWRFAAAGTAPSRPEINQ